MPKSETTSKLVASAESRVQKDAKDASPDANTRAASAQVQKPAKVSAGSERVIKGVSNVHREALKRLADR